MLITSTIEHLMPRNIIELDGAIENYTILNYFQRNSAQREIIAKPYIGIANFHNFLKRPVFTDEIKVNGKFRFVPMIKDMSQ
jgi:hypothetical protein